MRLYRNAVENYVSFYRIQTIKRLYLIVIKPKTVNEMKTRVGSLVYLILNFPLLNSNGVRL